MVRQQRGSDLAAVAFDAVHAARAQGAEVVIIDTAGRLHTRVNLMEELKKIRRVVERALPGAPHEVLLVVDASTGQNGLQQARQFDASVGVTGLVVTKLDGTAKADQARDEVIPLLLTSIEGVETNEKVKEIVDAVVAVYGQQDSGTITNSVETVELSTPQQPEFKIPIRDIPFHTTLLVPDRIDVQAEFTCSPARLAKLNAAMGYDGKAASNIQSW